MSFNYAPYAFAYDANPGCAIDHRHIQALFDLAMHHPLPSGSQRLRVCEAGSHRGASAAAWIEAINQGKDMEVVLCDIDLYPELERVMALCRHRSRVQFFQGRTEAILRERAFDIVFCDSSHDITTCAVEAALTLARDTPTVLCHDTNTSTGGQFFADVYRLHPRYVWYEDREKRPGEWTDRGLFLASRFPEVCERFSKQFQAQS